MVFPKTYYRRSQPSSIEDDSPGPVCPAIPYLESPNMTGRVPVRSTASQVTTINEDPDPELQEQGDGYPIAPEKKETVTTMNQFGNYYYMKWIAWISLFSTGTYTALNVFVISFFDAIMSHYDEGEVRNSTKSSRHYTSKTGFIFATTTTFISFVLFVIDAFLCYQLALKEKDIVKTLQLWIIICGTFIGLCFIENSIILVELVGNGPSKFIHEFYGTDFEYKTLENLALAALILGTVFLILHVGYLIVANALKNTLEVVNKSDPLNTTEQDSQSTNTSNSINDKKEKNSDDREASELTGTAGSSRSSMYP